MASNKEYHYGIRCYFPICIIVIFRIIRFESLEPVRINSLLINVIASFFLFFNVFVDFILVEQWKP